MNRIAKMTAAFMLTVTTSTVGSAVSAQQADFNSLPVADKLQPFPGLDLGSQQAKGQDAVARLGIHLPDVAAWYGKSPADFRNELLTDSRMRLDRNGRLFEVWEMNGLLTPLASPRQMNAILDGTLTSLDQTFALHSRPGSNRTIYLDFTGATVTSTAWNASQNMRTITAIPFDLDGNPASFSDSEKMRIQYIWQRVAEDYAPFDVDVTTQEPSPDLITRSDVNDKVFGTSVVVTKHDGVYSCTCGGIAYVGVFDALPGSHPANYYKPAFVFYDMLGAGDEKAVAEAISHEAGHNMGLHHDGQGSNTYYAGQGNDAVTGWAPIMGVGYYRPLVQFSKGEYANATNTEDDFIVAQNFGLPLRLDDYGSSPATATPFVQSISNGVVTGSMDGVIETANDRDVFAITAGTGTLHATVRPANRSPDADLVLTLLDSAGRPLNVQNPLNGLSSDIVYNLGSQGTYYLEVRGTGQGEPISAGYSNYGSVGNFRLTANYAAPVGTPPTAVMQVSRTTGTAPLSVVMDGRGSRDDGRVAFWYWNFGDGSSNVTGSTAVPTHVYQVAGRYLARLTVVDDTGLSASTTQLISVSPPAPQSSVASMTMSLKTNSKGAGWALGMVTVVNQTGNIIRGAKVTASWNGIVSKTATVATNASGGATFVSPKTKASGCFALTVTNISVAGYPFSQVADHTAQICR